MENLTQPLPMQEQRSTKPQSRLGMPRLGAFVTIAASLLLLFGAASRIGKVPETAALFGIDNQAENRIRQEEERQRTALMIGSIPVRRGEGSQTNITSVTLDPDAMPPTRGNFDIDSLRRPNGVDSGRDATLTLSIPQQTAPLQEGADTITGGPNMTSHGFDAGQPGQHGDLAQSRPKTYKVKNGDTWVKVAKNTLGDANRWREIMTANPSAQSGLRVGMELTVPGEN